MPKKMSVLRKKMADLRKEMKKEGQAVLKEVVKKFLEDHPVVEAIYWEQYTPYFNDGDACTFGVGDMWLKFNKTDEQKAKDREDEIAWAKRDGYPEDKYLGYSDSAEGANEEWWNMEYTYANKKNVRSFTKEEKAAAKDLKALYKDVVDEGVFEDLFGDHVRVRADRKGFTVTEYEHD